MPSYTIDVPEHLVPKLNVLVARYNADAGSDLSVQAWLELHARELAIADELQSQHAALVAQAEADVAAAELLVAEEAGAGDGRDADLADEVPGERLVVGLVADEGGVVGHDVVGPLRRLEVEADLQQGPAEPVAAGLVGGGEPLEVGEGQAIGDRAGLLH